MEAGPSLTHQPDVPHVLTPPTPYEMPQTAAVKEGTLQPDSQPQPVGERVVEHVAAEGAVMAPAVPLSHAPLMLPTDLEQVETSAEKVRVAATKVEAAPASRAPRVRPPPPSMSNAPLEQVETRR